MKLPDWLRRRRSRPSHSPEPAEPLPAVIDFGSTAQAWATLAHRAGQDARRLHVRHLSGTHEVDLDEVADKARAARRHWQSFLEELAVERRLGTQLADADAGDLTADDREDPEP